MRIINCSWYKPKNSWFFRRDFWPWQKYIKNLIENPIIVPSSSMETRTILQIFWNNWFLQSIAKRISETLSNEEIFNKSIKIYSKALKESGFTDELKYLPSEVQELWNKNRRKRRRKIIWFNPPYSKNVKTNVGKVFLKLLKRHFPTSHILLKVFNKSTVKITYGCMKNIKSVNSSHNKSILNSRTTSFWCNCRKKQSCPLNGECLTSQLVYRAAATNQLRHEEIHW